MVKIQNVKKSLYDIRSTIDDRYFKGINDITFDLILRSGVFFLIEDV